MLNNSFSFMHSGFIGSKRSVGWVSSYIKSHDIYRVEDFPLDILKCILHDDITGNSSAAEFFIYSIFTDDRRMLFMPCFEKMSYFEVFTEKALVTFACETYKREELIRDYSFAGEFPPLELLRHHATLLSSNNLDTQKFFQDFSLRVY